MRLFLLIFAWICWSSLLLYGLIRAAMVVGYAFSRGDPQSENKDASFLKFRLVNTILKTMIFIFLSILLFSGFLN